MRTRIIAVAIAAILAVVGGVILVNYVRTVSTTAAQGAQLTDVLVVTQVIPAGTSADKADNSYTVKQIPAAYVAPGAVTSASQLSGLVATAELEPGEQMLTSRWATAAQLSAQGGTAAVPTGMQEVAVAVDLQRIVGGRVGAGNHVGIYVSLDASGDQLARTSLLLDQVLVTSVTSSANSAAATATSATAATQGLVLVSVAVTADDAQKLVYALEFGKVWMSLENDRSTAATAGAVVTSGSIGR